MQTDPPTQAEVLACVDKFDADIIHWSRRLAEIRHTPLNSPLVIEYRANQAKAIQQWNHWNAIAWEHGYYE